MGYATIKRLLADDETRCNEALNILNNIQHGSLEMPYIMTEIAKALEDGNIFSSMIPDNNKIRLCNMLITYFDSCYQLFDDSEVAKYIPYAKVEVYRVYAEEGVRYATKGEVENGVIGLIAEDICCIEEHEYRKLNLLAWSFTGNNRFFKLAGYEVPYEKKDDAKNNFYRLIQQSAKDLVELMDWCSDCKPALECMSKIKEFRKSYKFNYTTYARDEITEDLSVKQLMYDANKYLPRGSSNEKYRRAISYIIRYNNFNKLNPMEISHIREAYRDYLEEYKENGFNKKPGDVITELKDQCDVLLKARSDGDMRKDHFVYAIIDTLQKNGYTKCSIKQKKVIDEATQLLNDTLAKKANGGNSNTKGKMNLSIQGAKKGQSPVNVLTDMDLDGYDIDLVNISNAIGKGAY